MESIPTIESVSHDITEWRRTNGQILSKEIWADIQLLCRRHSIAEISKAVGISDGYLYKKLGKKRKGKFVEVKVVQNAQANCVGPLIELRRSDGNEMRFRLLGPQQLAPLIASFLGQ